MSTNRIYGENIVLSSRSKNKIVSLTPEIGEELYVPEIKSNRIFSSAQSNTVGLNELGTSVIYQHPNTAIAHSQGRSVGIVDVGADSYLTFGSPYYIYGASLGGQAVFKSTAGGAFVNQALLLNNSFTSSFSAGEFSSINETGDSVYFTDYAYSGPSYINNYTRTGDVWSFSNQTIQGVSSRVSGNYVISSGNSNISIWFKSGTFSQQQILQATGILYPLVAISGSVCAYVYNDVIYVWTRSGVTWTQTASFARAGLVGLDLVGSTLVACSVSAVYFYSLTALINSINLSNITAVCTNDTFVFVSTTTFIKIFSLVSGIWTSSVNTTIDSASYKIACSGRYLAVGKPTLDSGFGQVFVYPISTYTNTVVKNNQIDFSGTDMVLSSRGNVRIDGNLVVSGSSSIFAKTYSLLTGSNSTSFANTAVLQVKAVYDGASTVESATINTDVEAGTLIVAESGLYLVKATCVWASNSTGLREIGIYNQANALLDQTLSQGVNGASTTTACVSILPLAAGTSLYVQVRQSSGAALNVFSASFSACKIGLI